MSQEYEFKVGGTLNPTHPSYVKRQADDDLYAALKAGEYCSLFNSRQMGKSSLEMRVGTKLHKEKFAVCQVDLSNIVINSSQNSQEILYKSIIEEISAELSILSDYDLNSWFECNNQRNYSKLLTKFFQDILLKKNVGQILISFDEVDSLFSCNFPADDFFASIRFCYNNRA